MKNLLWAIVYSLCIFCTCASNFGWQEVRRHCAVVGRRRHGAHEEPRLEVRLHLRTELLPQVQQSALQRGVNTWRDDVWWCDKRVVMQKKTWVRDGDVTWQYHLIHCVCNHVMHRRSRSHALQSSARHVTTAARYLIGWRQRLAIKQVFKLICNLHVVYYLCTRE